MNLAETIGWGLTIDLFAFVGILALYVVVEVAKIGLKRFNKT